MQGLIQFPPQHLQTVHELDRIGHEIRLESLQPNTKQAYDLGWRIFLDWCHKNKRESIEVNEMGYEHFLIFLAGKYKLPIIYICHSAIKWVYGNSRGFPPYPYKTHRIESLMKGIRKKKMREEEINQAQILTITELESLILGTRGDGAAGVRSRCVILLMFWGCLRGDELLKIKVEHFETYDGSTVLRVPEQKNHNETLYKSIPTIENKNICPKEALDEYLALFKLAPGDFIASSRVDQYGNITNAGKSYSFTSLQKALKKEFVRTFGEARGREYSTHSFRRSFVTYLLDKNVQPAEVATQSHQSIETIISRYDENRHKIHRNWVHKNLNFANEAR